jgi:putative redox protein
MMRDATVRTKSGKFQQDVEIAKHHLVADEPESAGGDDAGPAPHEFLLAALGACTSMTVKMYSDRKGWPLRTVEVKLSQAKENDVHVIRREVLLDGDLDAEQRARLI